MRDLSAERRVTTSMVGWPAMSVTARMHPSSRSSRSGLRNCSGPRTLKPASSCQRWHVEDLLSTAAASLLCGRGLGCSGVGELQELEEAPWRS